MSEATFKVNCRRMRIVRWPYRRVETYRNNQATILKSAAEIAKDFKLSVQEVLQLAKTSDEHLICDDDSQAALDEGAFCMTQCPTLPPVSTLLDKYEKANSAASFDQVRRKCMHCQHCCFAL